MDEHKHKQYRFGNHTGKRAPDDYEGQRFDCESKKFEGERHQVWLDRAKTRDELKPNRMLKETTNVTS